MARREELPAEVVSLEVLLKRANARRLQHLEKMANGLNELEYREHVGRAKELKWLVDEITQRKMARRSGEDIDG